MLPNFLCIGAQKCGTTALWLMLNQHPDIFLADSPRETQFFCADHLYERGAAYYERVHFASWEGERAVGEKTPAYLCVPGTARRIHDTLGTDTRLIVSFRSPSARAFSHFRHNYQELVESSTFEQALADESERTRRGSWSRAVFGYRARGLYVRQLHGYLRYFPPDALHPLVFEHDIARDQEAAVRGVFRFLEVDHTIALDLPVSAGRSVLPRVDIVDGGTKGLAPDQYASVRVSYSGDRTTVVRQPSSELLAYCRAFQRNCPTEASLPRDVELALNLRYFRDEILDLEQLIDRDLSHWLE